MPENFKKTTRKYFMAQINRNNNLFVAKKKRSIKHFENDVNASCNEILVVFACKLHLHKRKRNIIAHKCVTRETLPVKRRNETNHR